MAWSSIQYVTGGLTLVAFICLLVAKVLRDITRRERELIQAAPNSARARLIEQAIERYHFDTVRLSGKDTANLIDRQLSVREGRFRSALRYSLAALIILVLFSAFGIWKSSRPPILEDLAVGGIVLDIDERPISGVTVIIEGLDFVAETSAEGSFRGRISRSSLGALYTFVFMKKGYLRAARTVAVTGPAINFPYVQLIRQ